MRRITLRGALADAKRCLDTLTNDPETRVDYVGAALQAVVRAQADLDSPIPARRRTSKRSCIATNADGVRRRGFTYTANNLLRRSISDATDECTGACRCKIEPDGSCSKGWPSRMVAARLI